MGVKINPTPTRLGLTSIPIFMLACSLKSRCYCIVTESECFCGFLILHEETLHLTFEFFLLCWLCEHSLLHKLNFLP